MVPTRSSSLALEAPWHWLSLTVDGRTGSFRVPQNSLRMLDPVLARPSFWGISDVMALCVFLTCFSVREVIPKISLVPCIKKTMGQWQTSVSFTVLNEHKEIIEIYLFAVTQPRQLPIAFLSWYIKKKCKILWLFTNPQLHRYQKKASTGSARWLSRMMAQLPSLVTQSIQ